MHWPVAHAASGTATATRGSTAPTAHLATVETAITNPYHAPNRMTPATPGTSANPDAHTHGDRRHSGGWVTDARTRSSLHPRHFEISPRSQNVRKGGGW